MQIPPYPIAKDITAKDDACVDAYEHPEVTSKHDIIKHIKF